MSERFARVADSDWSNKGQPIWNALANGKPFRIGRKEFTFRPGPAVTLGDLPEPFRTDLRTADSHVQWVAYSYTTPIAWKLDTGQWIMPDVHYSLTTNGHQGTIQHVFNPTKVGPHVSLRAGNGTGRGNYGARRGGIDGPYTRITEARARVAMRDAESELKRWRFDASGIPIID